MELGECWSNYSKGWKGTTQIPSDKLFLKDFLMVWNHRQVVGRSLLWCMLDINTDLFPVQESSFMQDHWGCSRGNRGEMQRNVQKPAASPKAVLHNTSHRNRKEEKLPSKSWRNNKIRVAYWVQYPTWPRSTVEGLSAVWDLNMMATRQGQDCEAFSSFFTPFFLHSTTALLWTCTSIFLTPVLLVS